ncbi:MAG: hypothetical protein Q8L43_04010 [Deltaproteobacteria bacterium]|nr:hypothetical protein [Deltaproteobacteria bacterium]
MDDSTTSSERDRDERVRYVFELLLDLLFLATFSGGFDDFFFTVLVGVEKARLGEKVNARVIAALHNIRFTIQNLLCYGTILMGTKIRFLAPVTWPAMLNGFLYRAFLSSFR